MTPNELKRRFPNASKGFIDANRDQWIHPLQQQPVKRSALDRPTQRKVQGSTRFKIVFTIYAVRPLDWDNNHVKELQDCFVDAGILHGDDWRILRGEIIPEKVHKKEEEKTVVEIYKI